MPFDPYGKQIGAPFNQEMLTGLADLAEQVRSGRSSSGRRGSSSPNDPGNNQNNQSIQIRLNSEWQRWFSDFIAKFNFMIGALKILSSFYDSTGVIIPTGNYLHLTDNQSTVGIAGAASAPPASPEVYAVVQYWNGSAWTDGVIAIYKKT